MSVVPTPTAWAVTACSKMFMGEFAELDAKAEAQRVGGECIAYALYTAPVVVPDDQSKLSALLDAVERSVDKGHANSDVVEAWETYNADMGGAK